MSESIQSIPNFVTRTAGLRRRAARPTAREWARHSLLAILLAHESGHYVACRLYGVDATLPFFIPMPPPFLVGTLGAFIKIKSPIPSRRALFDIGVAGPLAGFLMLIPVAVVGLLTSVPAPPMPSEGVIIFNDPPLLRLLAKLLGVR